MQTLKNANLQSFLVVQQSYKFFIIWFPVSLPVQPNKCLALWVKSSADDILKWFSYFTQETGFDISHKLSSEETICMKCEILFSGKIKKIFQNVVCWSFYLACKVLTISILWANSDDSFLNFPRK